MSGETLGVAGFMVFAAVAGKILLTIFGIGFLVFVHELGHFLTAKAFGVRIEQFAIGFWKKIVSFKRGDTEYSLRVIPVGGYVKMAGEYPDQDHTGAEDEFYSKPPGQRALIVVAGVVMNAVVAILTFVVAFQLGVRLNTPEIEPVPGSPAWVAGIMPGDVILEINGKKVICFDDVLHETAVSTGEVSIKVRRGENIFSKTIMPKDDPDIGIRMIGVMSRASLIVGNDKGPIKKGDRLLAVGGEKLLSWNHFRRIVIASPGRSLEVVLARKAGGEESEMTVSVTPESIGGWELGCVSTGRMGIDQVQEGGPAWQGGVRKGDTIVSLNDLPIKGHRNFRDAIAGMGGQTVTLGVERAGEVTEMKVVPEYSADEGRAFVGIMFDVESIIGSVEAGSPAAAIGLQKSDRIIGIRILPDGDEIEISSWISFVNVVYLSKGEQVTIKWMRGPVPYEETVGPRRNESEATGFLGLAPQIKLVKLRLGLFDAVRSGLRDSYVWGVRLIETLGGLIRGRVSMKVISGPLGIPALGMHYIDRGFGTFLYFLGMLGVNFAVINVIIILPVIDGGVLILIGLEKLRGRPLALKTQTVLQQISAALLIGLILLLTVQDVQRMVGRAIAWFAG